MTDDREVVNHDVPNGILRRLFTGVGGALVAGSGVQTALTFSPSQHDNPLMEVALLILKVVIGAVLVYGSLFSLAQRWTVRRGSVRIESRSLFRSWKEELGPDDVMEFDLITGSDEGSTTWSVVLRTRAGKSLVSRSLSNEQDAIRLFVEMRRVFYGDTLPKFYGPPA